MKILTHTIAVAVIATIPFAASLQSSEARPGTDAEVTRLNYEGFQTCKALRGSGYKASISGYSLDGGGGSRTGGFSFRINYCFPSAGQCQRFVRNIHQHVSSIERLHHARCILH